MSQPMIVHITLYLVQRMQMNSSSWQVNFQRDLQGTFERRIKRMKEDKKIIETEGALPASRAQVIA